MPKGVSKTELEKWGFIATGLSVAALVHTFIAEVRYIPSPSMQPTLQIDDRVLVNKLSYKSVPVRRGDIIVFQPPEALSKFNIKGALVKRVIGLPGERVQVKNGQVYVGDRFFIKNYIAHNPKYDWGPQVIPPKSYLVLRDNRNQSFDGHNWGFLPQDRIIGRTFLRFWPPYRGKLF
jgi:signal peptidase I